MRRFKDEADELGRKTELVFPLPLSEGRFPGRIVILVSIGLALFIYGVWHYTATRDRSMVELVPPPPTASKSVTLPAEPAKPAETPMPLQPETTAAAPAEPAKPAEPPKPAEAPAPTASVAVPVPPPAPTPTPSAAPAPAVTLAPAPTPAPVAPPSAAVPPPASAKPPATATPVPAANASLASNPPLSGAAVPQANPPPSAVAAAGGNAQPAQQTASSDAPKVFGDDSAGVRIQLKAKAETWIQVTDESGKVLAMRTLKPGESYRVPNRNGLTLFTGNAGGLDVMVDGKKAPALGASGTVRRSVALEPDGLLAGE